MPLPCLRLAVTGCFLAASACPVKSASFTRTGGSAAWESTANWTPAGIPDLVTDNVTFLTGQQITGLSADRQVGDFTTGGNLTFSFGGSGKAITVNGDLTHSSGTLTLQASMGLVIAADATASLSGGLSLSNGAAVLNRGTTAFGSGPLPALDFAPVASSFSAGFYTFRNDGAVRFNPGTQLTMSNGVVVNTGAFIWATGGGSPFLTSYTQNNAAGKSLTMVTGGGTLSANNLILTTGTLFVNGTLNGSSTTLGTGSSGVFLSPGDDTTAVATMTLTGNAGTIGGSTWHFDLAGTAQGTQYDFINAWQNLNVGSLFLDVSLAGGFVPQPADSFTIVSAGNVNGMFTNATGSKITVPGAGTFNVTVGNNQVRLTNFTPFTTPEPGTGMQLAAGAAASVFRRRRVFTAA